MADLGPVVGALGELAAPLLGRALRSFLMTTLGMVTLGICVAGGSTAFLWDKSPLYGLLAGLCGLGLFGVTGVILAGKRAVGGALIEGLGRAQVGSRAVTAIFEALSESAAGQAVARLPLAVAEERLRAVVHRIITSPVSGGGLKASLGRKVRNELVQKVEALTVARFRAEPAGPAGVGDERGGIDVEKIGHELAVRVDQTIADQVRGVLKKATVVIVLGACAAQVALVYVLSSRVDGVT